MAMAQYCLPFMHETACMRTGSRAEKPQHAVTFFASVANSVHHGKARTMTADEATLSRLMAATQRGDKAAYRQLLGLCSILLRRFYLRRLPESALDDLVQETLLSLHRKRDSWDPARPFLPWLAAIARYRWVDHLRRVYARPEAALEDAFGVESGEAAIIARFGCDTLLAKLPPAQAAAIRATRIEGLSIAEASVALGQSESLVKVNVHRGLKRLAACVEDDR